MTSHLTRREFLQAVAALAGGALLATVPDAAAWLGDGEAVANEVTDDLSGSRLSGNSGVIIDGEYMPVKDMSILISRPSYDITSVSDDYRKYIPLPIITWNASITTEKPLTHLLEQGCKAVSIQFMVGDVCVAGGDCFIASISKELIPAKNDMANTAVRTRYRVENRLELYSGDTLIVYGASG